MGKTPGKLLGTPRLGPTGLHLDHSRRSTSRSTQALSRSKWENPQVLRVQSFIVERESSLQLRKYAVQKATNSKKRHRKNLDTNYPGFVRVSVCLYIKYISIYHGLSYLPCFPSSAITPPSLQLKEAGREAFLVTKLLFEGYSGVPRRLRLRSLSEASEVNKKQKNVEFLEWKQNTSLLCLL